MHWRYKAFIQNQIARLPPRSSRACYYALQKASGSFSAPKVNLFIQAALAFRGHIERQGGIVRGATFLEVGTGRRLTLPVILWLMGAERITTVDLYRYVRLPIIAVDLRALIAELDTFAACREYGLLPDRVLALKGSAFDLPAILKLCAINYVAPADAARLNLPDACVDYHISFTVLEHIPGPILRDILLEAARVVRPSGLTIHFVDHSDHFSHSDTSISAINFLQYEDIEWTRLVDNPYMYMNRLRADDYPALYVSAQHEIRLVESTQDRSLLIQLSSPSFRLASRFRQKSSESLATTTSWIVSRPRFSIS